MQGPAVEANPKFKDQLRGQYNRAERARGGRDSRRWGQRRMGTRSSGILWLFDIIGLYSEWNGELREDFELTGNLMWLEFNRSTLAENALKGVTSRNRPVRGYCDGPGKRLSGLGSEVIGGSDEIWLWFWIYFDIKPTGFLRGLVWYEREKESRMAPRRLI